jgi:manganese-dependent inorganic pyrophosphatase
MSTLVVTSYVEPDLDGFACALAYAEFLVMRGMPATCMIFGEPHLEAQYVLDRFGWTYPREVALLETDLVVLVDASDTQGITSRINPEQVVEIIDHRQAPLVRDVFPRADIQIEPVGAAATLIAEKYQTSGIAPTHQSAVLLYGAIASNTLGFRAKVTTDRDHRMAAWLAEIGQVPEDLVPQMFATKSDLRDDRLRHVMESEIAWFDLGGSRLGCIQLEITGARTLIAERRADVLTIAQELLGRYELDDVFVSIIALDEGVNYFVTSSPEVQSTVATKLGVRFVGDVARREGFVMRKEMRPLFIPA